MDMTAIREAVNFQLPILISLAGLSLLGLLAVIAVFVSFTTRSRFDGLEGIWYKATDPTYSYQFLPEGKVLVRNHGKEVGNACSWVRFANTLSVNDHRPQGDWLFTGEVKENEIQGQYVEYNEAGHTIISLQDEWRRVPQYHIIKKPMQNVL
ncbi:MAG: hypothetical protein QM703_18315 [Gemmatales bacterium]